MPAKHARGAPKATTGRFFRHDVPVMRPVLRRACAVAATAAAVLVTAPAGLADPTVDPTIAPTDAPAVPATTAAAPANAPAAPDGPPGAPGPGGALVDAPTLSWRDVGAAPTISFYGETSTTSMSFRVPFGVTPTAINATVDLPFAMRSGLLTVMQDDRLISKVGLPLADLAPIVLPLPGVEVIDGRVSLDLTLTSLADDRYCLDDFNPVTLINGSVAFAGREAPPTNIADFVPGVLRKITIAVPQKPTLAESDAAVKLAAALVGRYRTQAPEVLVVPLDGDAGTIDAPSIPLERQFVVKEGPEEGLSLQGTGGVPQLLISGPPNKLVNQVRLLTDSSLDMAVGKRAVAEQLHTAPVFPGNVTTLDQLGQQTLSASGVSPQVGIALDQTMFGHSTQGYRVHLLGSYTPLPSNYSGQLTATVNGETIDSWAPDVGGVIDRWVAIPDRLVNRYTSLRVTLNTTGNTGRCNEWRPATLTIQGNTVVESNPALPPIPPGFGSLPQALMPAMKIGIAEGNFADTNRAVSIVSGLQRLSVMPLTTEVTTVEQALAVRDPAVVISADGWTDPSITLPVTADGGRITLEGPDPGDPVATVMLDPGVRFGSLQTVFDGRRSLLIATSNGDAARLDDLLRWLSSEPKRWTQLRGNALVDFPGREPASVSGRMSTDVGGPAGETAQYPGDDGGYSGSSAWWAAGAVLLLGAVGASLIAVNARRARRDADAGDAVVDAEHDTGRHSAE